MGHALCTGRRYFQRPSRQRHRGSLSRGHTPALHGLRRPFCQAVEHGRPSICGECGCPHATLAPAAPSYTRRRCAESLPWPQDTLYGHQSPILAIDALSKERCITSGADRTVRLWKIVEDSQLLFQGHQANIGPCTASVCRVVVATARLMSTWALMRGRCGGYAEQRFFSHGLGGWHDRPVAHKQEKTGRDREAQPAARRRGQLPRLGQRCGSLPIHRSGCVRGCGRCAGTSSTGASLARALDLCFP